MTALVPRFAPTAENMHVISYPEAVQPEYDFEVLLAQSKQFEQDGKIEAACTTRFEAFQRLMELIPEEEELILDWDEHENQTLLMLIHSTALDHFLVGDFEMAAGMFEMLLGMDPEDHLNATATLAYCYVALEEYELFDEVINDISDKYPEKEILKMWSDFRQTGQLPAGEMAHLKKSFPAVYCEFRQHDHAITPEYLNAIESIHPSREAQARELWLQTEHLWAQFPGFIEALQAL